MFVIVRMDEGEFSFVAQLLSKGRRFIKGFTVQDHFGAPWLRVCRTFTSGVY